MFIVTNKELTVKTGRGVRGYARICYKTQERC